MKILLGKKIGQKGSLVLTTDYYNKHFSNTIVITLDLLVMVILIIYISNGANCAHTKGTYAPTNFDEE